MKIGVLAIQGDFELHQKVLDTLKIQSLAVRKKQDLERCDALIIPGGESTTFVKLLKTVQLDQSIIEFGQKKAIFGTCAGLILLSHKVSHNSVETLNLIDIEVSRNAYGRQINSFIDDVELDLNGKKTHVEGVFIRAPKIVRIGESVHPIGYHQHDIVMAENDHILVATFHPELTSDTQVHRYFLNKARQFI